MTTFDERANNLLRQVWGDIQRSSQRREAEAAKANPEKHRLTRIIPKGGTGYTYWRAGERMIGKTKKEKTTYCVATHKNAAGVFLIWREVARYKRKAGKWDWYETQRFDYQWAPTKAEAHGIAGKKAEKHKLEVAHAAAAKLPHAPPEAYAMLNSAIG